VELQAQAVLVMTTFSDVVMAAEGAVAQLVLALGEQEEMVVYQAEEVGEVAVALVIIQLEQAAHQAQAAGVK